MKKYIFILSILFLGGFVSLYAQKNAYSIDSSTSQKKIKKALQLRDHKNMISFGGGTALGTVTGPETLFASIFNVSYQRDLIKRLSIELQFENYHVNSFPDFATHSFAYLGQETEAVKNYILTELDASSAMGWAWVRSNTASLGMNVLFHMVERKHHRFSVYAGIGLNNMSGIEYRLTGYLFNRETLKLISYTDDTRQYNANYWFWDCGLRYSYIFIDKFALGIDFGYFRTPYFEKIVDSDVYFKANLVFGVRL
ncbi:MAG: hypothetical protein RR190_01515 [Bacteroidales bacterium]